MTLALSQRVRGFGRKRATRRCAKVNEEMRRKVTEMHRKSVSHGVDSAGAIGAEQAVVGIISPLMFPPLYAATEKDMPEFVRSNLSVQYLFLQLLTTYADY